MKRTCPARHSASTSRVAAISPSIARPAAEIEPIRQEFLRYLETRAEWDHRTGELLMTEAHPESVELRLAMSSATIGDLWTLRCMVREHMVAWLRRNQPEALIRHRLGVDDANAAVTKG